jgi:hypothetical protein
LSDEIQHLRKTFRQKGYNATAFSRAINKKHMTTTEKQRSIGVGPLPFQQSTSYKISRLLQKFNMKTVNMPAKKGSHTWCVNKVIRLSLWWELGIVWRRDSYEMIATSLLYLQSKSELAGMNIYGSVVVHVDICYSVTTMEKKNLEQHYAIKFYVKLGEDTTNTYK